MHPKEVTKFIAWSKAMVAGATVDKPRYPGTSERANKARAKPQRGRQRRRRRKKRKAQE